jgi:hypothetical protein
MKVWDVFTGVWSSVTFSTSVNRTGTTCESETLCLESGMGTLLTWSYLGLESFVPDRECFQSICDKDSVNPPTSVNSGVIHVWNRALGNYDIIMIGVDSPGNNKGLLLWLPVSLLKLPCSEVKSRGGAPIGIQVCPMKDIRNGDKGRGHRWCHFLCESISGCRLRVSEATPASTRSYTGNTSVSVY